MSTPTHSLDDFDFTGGFGGEAAKESAKSQGLRFDRPEWFRPDGSEAGIARGLNRDILRFLTDHVPVASNPIPWITVGMHSMVPTRPKPADYPEGRSWPKSMGAVCREDKIFKGRLAPCYIDTLRKSDGKKYFASPRTWALAVRREEVLGTQEMVAAGQIQQYQVGTTVGYKDRTKEVAVTDENGKVIEGATKTVADVVIVQQAWKNFWSILDGFAQTYGTVLDRDYLIIRNGSDQSTTYQIVPMDVIMRPDGTRYDLRDPDLFQSKYPNLPDLRAEVLHQADDEYYATFFDVTKPQPVRKKADSAQGGTGQAPAQQVAQQAAPSPAQPAAPSHEAPSSDALAALKARVVGHNTAAQPAEQPAQQAPQTDAGAIQPAPASTPQDTPEPPAQQTPAAAATGMVAMD